MSGPGGVVGRGLGLLALALLALPAGCASGPPFTAGSEPPPVAQVSAIWQKQVHYAADPTHSGAQTPGLAGRLYLFGTELSQPLVGDGSLTVVLYDDAPPAGGQPKQLEAWNLDKDTLKRLVRRDVIGDGYTLFLPWGTYRPDITQVHLVVCYAPQKGSPVYSQGEPLLLTRDDPPQVTSRTVTGAPPASATPAGYGGRPVQGVVQAAYAPPPPPPPSASPARWPTDNTFPCWNTDPRLRPPSPATPGAPRGGQW
jgi:hypothetical protein